LSKYTLTDCFFGDFAHWVIITQKCIYAQWALINADTLGIVVKTRLHGV